MRTLRDLTADLVALHDEDDWEKAHYRADELLIEAIEILAAYATDTTNEGESDTLIEAWREIGKWYA